MLFDPIFEAAFDPLFEPKFGSGGNPFADYIAYYAFKSNLRNAAGVDTALVTRDTDKNVMNAGELKTFAPEQAAFSDVVESRTNLALYSQDFSNAYWNKQTATIEAGHPDPDGGPKFFWHGRHRAVNPSPCPEGARWIDQRRRYRCSDGLRDPLNGVRGPGKQGTRSAH